MPLLRFPRLYTPRPHCAPVSSSPLVPLASSRRPPRNSCRHGNYSGPRFGSTRDVVWIHLGSTLGPVWVHFGPGRDPVSYPLLALRLRQEAPKPSTQRRLRPILAPAGARAAMFFSASHHSTGQSRQSRQPHSSSPASRPPPAPCLPDPRTPGYAPFPGPRQQHRHHHWTRLSHSPRPRGHAPHPFVEAPAGEVDSPGDEATLVGSIRGALR